jgi:hypothetical protein
MFRPRFCDPKGSRPQAGLAGLQKKDGARAVTTSSSEQIRLFQMQDLCRRLGVPVRDARYVCEKNWLPPGVPQDPGRGNHRLLTPRQAMWLGIVLKFKAAGIKTPLAVRVAAFAESIRGMSKNLVWDWKFSPFDGALDTDHRWNVEVGDQRYIRFVTDANPTEPGLHEMTWVEMGTGQEATGVRPIVCVCLDLSALARLLEGAPRDPDGHSTAR